MGICGYTPETIEAVEFLVKTTNEEYHNALERYAKSLGPMLCPWGRWSGFLSEFTFGFLLSHLSSCRVRAVTRHAHGNITLSQWQNTVPPPPPPTTDHRNVHEGNP